ncbi:3,4-dihydroxy-2-butanone-4-phosphate synthase [Nocardia asteroides]|uniref:3,4-dihydroxy-2-butanone-4-phosphate synthase n=1 Tax=Nocardia asteroides TaxID=1824 RepID=UPI001E5D6B76|nr:3,4-dihydroxy-2-butanone-4-phosphate synthase [Nocardia asteroides]UGT61843.1 3,4-dihydroxy-2-butanone-4-phosphate synthase [Nocardia asteroides]
MTTSFTTQVAAPWSTLVDGVCALGADELIILHHDGRFVLAGCAGTATTEQLAFLIRHSTGFVQVALHERDCDRLLLPEATPDVRDAGASSYGQCVAVDAALGVTTGISGADRARTARVLADPDSNSDDLNRPGHLVPVRVNPFAFQDRLSAAAVALALTDAARPECSGALFADIAGIVDPAELADARDAETIAARYGLTTVSSVNP